MKTHTTGREMLWKNIAEFVNRGSLLCDKEYCNIIKIDN